jgi:gliding motility associated protien GldN
MPKKMNDMKKVLIASLFLLGLTVNAQINVDAGPINVPVDGIIDGVFIKEHVVTKKMVPYTHVREADVIWSRRVWESIDLREKINHPLYYPLDDVSPTKWTKNGSRLSLWTVIRQGIMDDKLTVFSPFDPELRGMVELANDGDMLKYPIKPSDPGLGYSTDTSYQRMVDRYMATIGEAGTVPKIDEIEYLQDGSYNNNFGQELLKENPDGTIWYDLNGNTSYVYDDPDTNWYTSKDIIQYRLKEDWFFDKQRSVLDVRIIAIAPVVYTKDKDGTITGMEELFWLYFPHCRYLFNNYFTHNDKNNAQWMSFDDLFWKRRFNAVIYKQNNTYDRKIESYRAGVDALYESEAIKNEIRNIEHDVWSF